MSRVRVLTPYDYDGADRTEAGKMCRTSRTFRHWLLATCTYSCIETNDAAGLPS